MRRTTSIAIAAVISSFARVAHGDGAFPDAQSVLLPEAEPNRIALAATFGLVVSDDGGATWQYSCESLATVNGRLYTQGPPPEHRIFALSDRGAAVSADGGCTWRLGGGLYDGGLVFDVFPDPVDAQHALVVAQPPGLGAAMPAQVFVSWDGGLTYGDRLFTGPEEGGISGVEIARSDSRTIYVTTSEVGADDGRAHARLAFTNDAGTHWDTLDLEPRLGPGQVSIAAVGPTDAARLYLRVSGKDASGVLGDRLAVSFDGGTTFTTPVSVPGGALTAFLARANGTVFVAATAAGAGVPFGFRSRDGGRTFEPWQPGLHPRGFGERGSTLFAAADNLVDGFALASSEDDGDTWTPRMRFSDIQAIRSCVQKECLEDCGQLMSIGLFAPAVCRAGMPMAVMTPGAGSCATAGAPPSPGASLAVALAGAAALAGWVLSRRRGTR